MINQLSKFGVEKSNIEKLKAYKSRDGFVLIDNKEFSEMIAYFKQFPVYKEIIPIMTDGQSNYSCLYIAGPMEGMICHLAHGEQNLEPKFKDISNFIKAIESNNAYDFFEFDESVFDFPATRDFNEFPNRKRIIDQLSIDLKTETDEQRIQQTAFSIMALALANEIESIIYSFLDHEDMYIQERAIELLGFHKYRPAKDKLKELTTKAMYNGQTAAKIALKKIGQ